MWKGVALACLGWVASRCSRGYAVIVLWVGAGSVLLACLIDYRLYL
jgi:hypothetical protein